MSDNYRHRSAISITQAVTSLVVVASLATGIVLASEIVLTLFLAILFGVFLRRLASKIDQWVPLPTIWSIATVVAGMFVLAVGSSSLFYVQIDRQIDAANKQIDNGVEKLQQLAKDSPTLRSIVTSIPFLSETIDRPSLSAAARQGTADSDSSEAAANTGTQLPELDGLPEPVRQAADTVGRIFKTTFGLVVNSMLIFFVGLFLAISPDVYRDGVVKLVPRSKRARAVQVLDELGDTLWRWLLGRLGSMLVTGVGAALALWLAGVPMAISLGIMTGLLTFIPNIGAAIALALAMLFALPQGTTTAMLVLPAYLGLQLIESYIVTPLIQKRQVEIPPALLIAFQAIMGVLFGILGAAVASPLLAALKVTIERLYVEDVLESSA